MHLLVWPDDRARPTDKQVIALALAIGVGLSACGQGGASVAGSPSATPGVSPSATTVEITTSEFKIELSTTQLPSGTVTFRVKNAGTVVHEFVVIKADLAVEQLPVPSGLNEVDEEAPGLTAVGEVEDVAPGATKEFTADLTAGKYVGICNIKGHYTSGMRVSFTVS